MRLVDLFETVTKRPYLYTLDGNYEQTIAFLDGCYFAFTHHHIKSHDKAESQNFRDILNYQHFLEYLSRTLKLDQKDALRSFKDEEGNPYVVVLAIYTDFKRAMAKN